MTILKRKIRKCSWNTGRRVPNWVAKHDHTPTFKLMIAPSLTKNWSSSPQMMRVAGWIPTILDNYSEKDLKKKRPCKCFLPLSLGFVSQCCGSSLSVQSEHLNNNVRSVSLNLLENAHLSDWIRVSKLPNLRRWSSPCFVYQPFCHENLSQTCGSRDFERLSLGSLEFGTWRYT